MKTHLDNATTALENDMALEIKHLRAENEALREILTDLVRIQDNGDMISVDDLRPARVQLNIFSNPLSPLTAERGH